MYAYRQDVEGRYHQLPLIRMHMPFTPLFPLEEP